MGDLWEYKRRMYGDNPEGQQKLLGEIEKFVDEHPTNSVALNATNNFVVYHQSIVPDSLKEKLWSRVPQVRGAKRS